MKYNILLISILVFVLTFTLNATATEYNEAEVEKIIYDAAREIEPDFSGGLWYLEDDEHFGQVGFSDYGLLESEERNIDYWDMDKRMDKSENPEWVVSSGVLYSAPTPGGHRIVVQVEGYNIPLSAIEPVAENIFIRLVEEAEASGALSETTDTDDTTGMQAEEYPEEEIGDYTETPISDSEDDTLQDPESDDTVPMPDSTPENDDSEFTDDEVTDAADPEDGTIGTDELFFIYDVLEEEELIENKGEIDVEDINKQDIEDIQNIQMNYVLSDEFVESMQEQAKIIDMIRSESSEDMDKLDEMGLDGEQEVEINKNIIKDIFGEDFTFKEDDSVEIGNVADYEGKEKVAEKLEDTIYLDAVDKTRKESMKKLKTGHEAASFFSDDYTNSKISKTFDKLDKLNKVKEEVDKYVGAYKDYEKLSEMKGSSGTTAKALYVVSKGGQEVADKIPVAGELVKKGLEVTEKVVMTLPNLDNAIKNSDARQGVITNGPIGTSTPNAFLSEHGKVTSTSNGNSYSMPYTDENGDEHEIHPYQWVKVTTKGETYYIPTDEWENPIGDVALKDTGSSWKPWKWDNCQVVKRSNPAIAYNNGEEYDL